MITAPYTLKEIIAELTDSEIGNETIIEVRPENTEFSIDNYASTNDTAVVVKDELDELIKLDIVTESDAVTISPQDMLYQAILDDSGELIDKAIKKGAQICFERDGKTPLMLAVLLKRSNAVKFLLEFGAKANKTLLDYAIMLGDCQSALAISKYGNFKIGNINLRKSSTELHAIVGMDIEPAVCFIKNGISVALPNAMTGLS
ncbi:MAG TPA: ankyrin repeat domain-containing protein [Candidatus Babeliaceae bacterium]|nr:ankyrin repeat domain-containing protein [Candidatus Babeliaceae bacterium]